MSYPDNFDAAAFDRRYGGSEPQSATRRMIDLAALAQLADGLGLDIGEELFKALKQEAAYEIRADDEDDSIAQENAELAAIADAEKRADSPSWAIGYLAKRIAKLAQVSS